MIRVLLVDDEPLVLSLMKKVVDWKKYEMEVVGTAYDGASAIDFIKRNPVEIVFTDIKMPHMDGVELIKRVKEYLPNVLFVVISSYSDFSLVKESFQNGATDYILKIDIDNPSVIEPLMEKLYQKYRSQQLDLQGADAVFLKLPISHTEREYYFFRLMEVRFSGSPQILQITEELFSLQKDIGSFCCALSNGRLLFLAYGNAKENVVENSRFLTQKILESPGSASYWVGCSAVMKSLQPDEILKQAETAAGYRFYYPDERCFEYQEQGQDPYQKILDEISVCLENPAYMIRLAELMQMAHRLFDEAARLLVPPESLKEDAAQLYRRMYQAVCGKPCKNTGNLREAPDIIAMGAEFDQLVNQQIILENQPACHVGDMIEAYVESHYFEPELSISKAAEQLGISKQAIRAYLSDEKNMYFKQYLNTVRIQHAKELLSHTFLHVNEVAERVGYLYVEHFSRMFTKIVGKSPIQYAKSSKSHWE